MQLKWLKPPSFQRIDLRDTWVKVVFPFPKPGLLCKEIITLRLLPHVIKGHTFSYRPSSHLKNLIQQTREIAIITIASRVGLSSSSTFDSEGELSEMCSELKTTLVVRDYRVIFIQFTNQIWTPPDTNWS